MNKKVRFLSVAASMALAASLGTPALAANSGAVPVTGGTDVYAGVTTKQDASNTNLKVTVPTLFSFVVATAAESDNTGKVISVDKGTLLLPNVKVDAAGKVSTVGQSQLYFTNYSTVVKATTGSYEGLAVNVKGAVSTAGTSSKWTYDTTAAEAYQYNLTLNSTDGTNNKFDQLQDDGSYACATAVLVGAPTVDGVEDVDANKTALVGKTEAVSIGVNVGGTTTNYTKDEASAKVGTIVWTITAQ